MNTSKNHRKNKFMLTLYNLCKIDNTRIKFFYRDNDLPVLAPNLAEFKLIELESPVNDNKLYKRRLLNK